MEMHRDDGGGSGGGDGGGCDIMVAVIGMAVVATHRNSNIPYPTIIRSTVAEHLNLHSAKNWLT
jgi:hypothetical protein